ncbi:MULTISPECIES: hypothetical protein [Burkholderia]|jgi:hypothetical protein|uniref:Uncharacterized protein n=3 Tax=Burkholderia gladioli TaxID=28095 RepID=A0A095W6V8_BURGA|nr:MULTISPECIES: hypothetical protein [Burkholderia]AEA60001.1 hypothetical protein bgla_1g13270 [Burkholderia gladioli BSR3]AJW99446.1 hypothetical protein BM43_2659 [Burkholderia gladioli]ASD78674.1 hypothetical protein CEJ98_06400 [Burkholderia gladioli pv. gladioli]ATF84871.1 hypothetical protein CO712_07270 [Burkholderia gladioli pv. gladioli]AWY56081.1 hypothetical protein A8H28_34755 [Burkholderia gladioli pv. gladioli]
MRTLIENRLYHPSVVLPMVSLMQLMVTLDFNLGQVGFVVAGRGVRAAVERSRSLIDCLACRNCHCAVH